MPREWIRFGPYAGPIRARNSGPILGRELAPKRSDSSVNRRNTTNTSRVCLVDMVFRLSEGGLRRNPALGRSEAFLYGCTPRSISPSLRSARSRLDYSIRLDDDRADIFTALQDNAA